MTNKRKYQAVDRRQALKIAAVGALTVLGLNSLTRPARATAESTAAEIAKLIGDAKIVPAPASLKLTLPEIAEDGSQVQVTVAAEGPMPDGSRLREIHVLAQDNPQPLVVSFKLSPLLAKDVVTTRIRLAQTEDVVILGISEKGTAYSVRKNVKVTIGGCGG